MDDKQKQEKIGELFIFGEIITFATFPIIINYATRLMPPVFFAALSILLAGLCLFPYLIFTKQIRTIFNRKLIKFIIGVALFIVIIPSIFIFIGTSKTSSINTTLLLQTELLFTFIICGLFFGEKITLQKILGGLAVVIGATIILYKKSFQFNIGDILIIAGTVFYPIGNIFAKKALKISTPSVILFMRSIIGGLFLLLVSFYFENFSSAPFEYVKINWKIILLNGAVVYLASKLLWYKGFRYIDISKAISISMAMPAISLVYAAAFLYEIPTIQQITGFVVAMIGLLLLTRRKKDIVYS